MKRALLFTVAAFYSLPVLGSTPDPLPVVPDPLPVVQVDGDAAPTPHSEVERVLALLPKPKIGFVDYGCGPDARWCLAAAKRWGCRVTGVEIDPYRAAAAKERVRNSGLAHLITIVVGDAITTDVQADVGVAYLYGEVLWDLKPKIEKLAAFASYLHHPPVLATQNGDSWFYVKPQPVALVQPVAATWGGRTYTGPVCSSPNCAMCQSLRSQISAQQSQPTIQRELTLVRVKYCQNGRCWYQDEWR